MIFSSEQDQQMFQFILVAKLQELENEQMPLIMQTVIREPFFFFDCLEPLACPFPLCDVLPSGSILLPSGVRL